MDFDNTSSARIFTMPRRLHTHAPLTYFSRYPNWGGHVFSSFPCTDRVQVGIYGRVEDNSAREHSRRLEHFVASQHGRKSLCGQNFYERAEFWGGFPTYDPHEYHYLRDKYQVCNITQAGVPLQHCAACGGRGLEHLDRRLASLPLGRPCGSQALGGLFLSDGSCPCILIGLAG